MEAVLFQIRPNDVHQVLSGLCLFGLGSGASKGVVANVPLDDLRHQTIHGAARGGDQAQHIAAFRVAVQGTRQGLDLSTNAGHAMRGWHANRILRTESLNEPDTRVVHAVHTHHSPHDSLRIRKTHGFSVGFHVLATI